MRCSALQIVCFSIFFFNKTPKNIFLPEGEFPLLAPVHPPIRGSLLVNPRSVREQKTREERPSQSIALLSPSDSASPLSGGRQKKDC